MSHVIVTGATGHIGSHLIDLLRQRGVTVTAVGRTAERLGAAVAQGAQAAVGHLEDTEFLTRTFTGADAVFAMIPPSPAEPDFLAYQRKIVESLGAAVESAGVPRVVALSSVGAEHPAGTGPITGVHWLEQRLGRIPGLHSVHLRPAYFMENHLNGLGLIRGQGIYGSPLQGDIPFPMVATRDIAAAAADLLAEPAFEGRSIRYLLGDRDYTLTEAATILGTAIGKPGLPYVQFPYDAAREALVGGGLSPSFADDYVEMSQGFNSGHIGHEGRTKANTTATSLEEFARTQFVPAWGGQAG
jgi:uncharacterized protein YbjT (DUF2867 family)